MTYWACGHQFCGECGCQNPDGFKFCGQCAAAIVPPISRTTKRSVDFAWVWACVVFAIAAAVILIGLSSPDRPPANGSASAERARRLSALSETERNCLGMYLKYDRVSLSDLTMSQIQRIQLCQSLGLYHDL